MSLGTAITISGAAASPNMGYHSSPALRFCSRCATPASAPGSATRARPGEHDVAARDPLLGAGAARCARCSAGRRIGNPYVYLSDGGHFENLGLYEMVRAAADTSSSATPAASATTPSRIWATRSGRSRIDLGHPDRCSSRASDRRRSRTGNRHGAFGVIRYSAVDGAAADGVLLYLKATLSGDEPVDVGNYATGRTRRSPTIDGEPVVRRGTVRELPDARLPLDRAIAAGYRGAGHVSEFFQWAVERDASRAQASPATSVAQPLPLPLA